MLVCSWYDKPLPTFNAEFGSASKNNTSHFTHFSHVKAFMFDGTFGLKSAFMIYARRRQVTVSLKLLVFNHPIYISVRDLTVTRR